MPAQFSSKQHAHCRHSAKRFRSLYGKSMQVRAKLHQRRSGKTTTCFPANSGLIRCLVPHRRAS